ncbi:MAG: hypothetical protein IJ766_10030 [Clostridia bacterium]|nr:hypothetical protein [Clostridia bacterium]
MKKRKKTDDAAVKTEIKNHAAEEIPALNIPDDEIWTYQVEGLAPPHIGKTYTQKDDLYFGDRRCRLLVHLLQRSRRLAGSIFL